MPAAVLMDMDGTLVDTEPYWIECEFALAERHGGTWSPEHGLAVIGLDLIDSATYMREHMGIDLTPREIIEELLVGVVHRIEQEMPWRPGAVSVAALNANDVPCALVTMSWRRFVSAGSPGTARGLLRRRGLRRRGLARQAASRALSAGG